ncbi:MAG TPA: hypothetical protein VGQ42_08355 [Candidatus Dormibacteraeota bacterium]|jgi:hypothetical protein|nr:hypothetical protein [Candidatus Dormibacteraeota bacterium]
MDEFDNNPAPYGAPPVPPRRTSGLSRRAGVAVTSAGLLVGGLAGGFLIAHAQTSTATATPAPSTSTPSTGTTTPADGTFKPNEDPTHEAGESAAREAQENAGQRPTVP